MHSLLTETKAKMSIILEEDGNERAIKKKHEKSECLY